MAMCALSVPSESECYGKLYGTFSYIVLSIINPYTLYIGSCPSRGATDSLLGAAPHEGLLILYWELPLTRGSCHSNMLVSTVMNISSKRISYGKKIITKRHVWPSIESTPFFLE